MITKPTTIINAAPTRLGRSGSFTDADGNTITAGSGINTGTSPPGRGFNGIGVQAPNFSALLNFLQSTYEAAADLAAWPRAELERHPPEPFTGGSP